MVRDAAVDGVLDVASVGPDTMGWEVPIFWTLTSSPMVPRVRYQE